MVATSEDLHKDPQLKHRDHYRRVDHPVIGPHTCESPGFRFSKSPIVFDRPAPCLGEHNRYVCMKILGIQEEEFQSMEKAGVFR